MPRTVYVTCPICKGMMEVNTHNGKVLRHFEPREDTGSGDLLSDALKDVDEGTAKREAMFREAREREKGKFDILDRAFRVKKKEIEDSGDTTRPLRDIDLD